MVHFIWIISCLLESLNSPGTLLICFVTPPVTLSGHVGRVVFYFFPDSPSVGFEGLGSLGSHFGHGQFGSSPL